MDVSRALAKHDAHAVPLDQSPICCVLPTDMEAKHVVEILGASIDVGNSEYEGPRRDLRLHACLPSFVSIGPQYRIWRHPHTTSDVAVGSDSFIRRLSLNVRFARKRTWLGVL